jgi:carbohydrate diacid regulator
MQDDIIQDGGNTHFKFSFNGVKFLGTIIGNSEVEKNYATLIIGFIEFSQVKTQPLSFDEQLSLILLGNVTKSRVIHFMNKYSIKKLPVFVMLIKCDEGRTHEVIEFLRSYFYTSPDGAVSVSNDTVAYIKYVEPDEFGELTAPTTQAELFKRSIFEELGIVVKVFIGGIVKSFSDVAISFNQALSIEKMSELFVSNSGVFDYKNFILTKMIEDTPKTKVEEYLDVLLPENKDEILSDKELLNTGNCYLANNLNVSETARELYIHRNTLIYRIDKIEKLTGLDIKNFNDALSFRIIYILSKLK